MKNAKKNNKPLIDDSQNTITIDSNIPIPEPRFKMEEIVDMINKMKVGESFFISDPKRAHKLRCSIYQNYKTIKITSRKTEENGIKGVRFWKIG